MRVYLTGAFELMDRRVGYGNASYYIYETMKKLGVDVHIKDVKDNSPYDADIEISFDQPSRYRFMCPTSYKIGYTPWESTEFLPNWWRNLNAVDEVWTTSYWCENIFQQKLPNKPVFTYQHGIDHKFRPKKRVHDLSKPFTFLFIGEPYWRKDGDLVARTFAEFFGDDPDYRLIIKATNINTIKIHHEQKNIFGSPEALYDNIITMTNMLTSDELIMLYEEADVFLYPSWGEGFGFNPLQAMAMGIPTVCTEAWADYRDYITVPLDSTLHLSPWQEIHPGFMLKPNHMRFRAAVMNAKDNYDEWSSFAFKQSFKIHEEYDWEKVTRPAVDRLEKIYESRNLKRRA